MDVLVIKGSMQMCPKFEYKQYKQYFTHEGRPLSACMKTQQNFMVFYEQIIIIFVTLRETPVNGCFNLKY